LKERAFGAGSDAARMPSRRDVLLLALTGMAAGLASVEAAAIEADVPRFESGRYQFTFLRPAQELPSLRLFRLEGGTTDLSALRGKPILLNFWTSWCAACRMELPALDRLYRDAWRGRVRVAAVSEDRGPREMVARFVK
jgi:thiol-disulfide isomerase/thioredoxin